MINPHEINEDELMWEENAMEEDPEIHLGNDEGNEDEQQLPDQLEDEQMVNLHQEQHAEQDQLGDQNQMMNLGSV